MEGDGKHSVLVVGAGSIGERHVRCFQRTARADVSVCEVDPERREKIATRYGVRRAYGDLEEALDGDAPQVVVICTPANLHVPMASRCAASGLHILIEKPLSTSVEGVAELEESVRRQDLVAAVAYVYRCHPVLDSMKRALDSGRFGRPLQLTVHAGQHFPTYRPAFREIYYADRATGGGAIQDALTHLINAGEWLVGPVTGVVADAAHLRLEGVAVEDTVHVIARHGPVLGVYSLNQHQAPNELAITVAAERGTCRFESHKDRWRWMDEPDSEWQDGETAGGLERDEVFLRQAHAFLDAAEGKRPPPCTLREAEQTLRVQLQVIRSVDDTTKFLATDRSGLSSRDEESL